MLITRSILKTISVVCLNCFKVFLISLNCKFRIGTAVYLRRMTHYNLMSKKVLFVLSCLLFSINLACRSEAQQSENVNAAVNVKEFADVPPGFSTSPVPMSGNTTPGIPDLKSINANNLSNGATPIPGIPDPKTIGKTPIPKKTPPIPGIPDEATLKKQMNTIMTDVNVVNNPPKSETGNANSRPKKKQRPGKLN